MKTGFVIGLGFLLAVSAYTGRIGYPGSYAGQEGYTASGIGSHMAGFDSSYIRMYDPVRADGVSRVGEPDREAAEASPDDSREAAAGAFGLQENPSDGQETAGETEAAEAATGTEGEWVSLGDDWVITYYCPLECCNDQWAWQTSTESPMQLHHTIAVDPSVIPYYTHVRIEGLDYEYVAEDCGGGIKGNRIDVLVDNCTVANELGVDRNVEVWVQRR